MLLCLPTAVLLASVSLALLAGQLRCRLRRAMNRRLSDLATARPGHEGLHDDTAAPSARPRPDGYPPCTREPCCQTPIALPAGSLVIATQRSPSGYGLVVTSPPASVTRARASSMSRT
jgi:hypothetical protein